MLVLGDLRDNGFVNDVSDFRFCDNIIDRHKDRVMSSATENQTVNKKVRRESGPEGLFLHL